MSSGMRSKRLTWSELVDVVVGVVVVVVVAVDPSEMAVPLEPFAEDERSMSEAAAEEGVEMMVLGFCFFMSTKLILALVTGSIKGETSL